MGVAVALPVVVLSCVGVAEAVPPVVVVVVVLVAPLRVVVLASVGVPHAANRHIKSSTTLSIPYFTCL